MADQVNKGGSMEDLEAAEQAALGEFQVPEGHVLVTQDQLNAAKAQGKRSDRAKLAELQKQAAAFQQLRGEVSDLLESGLIEGVEDLSDFREKASSVINETKSEAEKSAALLKKQSKELSAAQAKAEQATLKFQQATIDRAIKDAAPPKSKTVSQGATNLIARLLADSASLDENDNVVVSMLVKDEDGTPEMKALTPEQAVAQLEQDVTNYGTLFVSTVNGGAGGEVIDGVKRNPEGAIDLGSLATTDAGFEKFMEIAAKNPEALLRTIDR